MLEQLSKPRLTYFSSRGRAEIVRLVLAELALDHDEVHVGLYNSSAQPAAFLSLRESGALPFGALPLWEETDGLRLVQSMAIVRHLARAHGLYGQTPAEAALCDMAAEGVTDMLAAAAPLINAPEERRAALREQVIGTDLPIWLRRFSALLRAQDFVAGASLTFADLLLWLRLENFLDSGLISLYSHPPLHAFFERIGGRPRILSYRQSARRLPVQYLYGTPSAQAKS